MNRTLIPALLSAILVLAGCYSRILPEPPQDRQGVLAVASVSNMRELGGLSGYGGKTVRWGLLVLSGGLDTLTPRDRDFLFGHGGDRMGIETVVDFRHAVPRLDFGDGLGVTGTSSERTRAPGRIPSGVLWDGDTGIPENVMTYDFGNILWNWYYYFDDIVGNMLLWYRDLVTVHREQYLGFFQALLEADGASVLFHCSTGKGRSNVAAALLLMALGVSNADIVDNYMLSLDLVHESLFPVVPFVRGEMVRYMRERRPDALVLAAGDSDEATLVRDGLRLEARREVLRGVMQDVFRGFVTGDPDLSPGDAVEKAREEMDGIIATLDDPLSDGPEILAIRAAIDVALEGAMDLMLDIGRHSDDAEFEAWANTFAWNAGNNIKPLLSVFPQWIEAAMTEVWDTWGGIDGFLDDYERFGMSGEDVVARLRELYLEN